MMDHFRKYAVLYGLAVWTVTGMFTMGGRTTAGAGSEYARVLR